MIEPESRILRVDLIKIGGLFLVLSICFISFLVPLKGTPPTVADANAVLQTWFSKAMEGAPCKKVYQFIDEQQCRSDGCPDVYLRLVHAYEVCSSIPGWFESCLTDSAKSCLMSGGDCAAEEALVLQCFEQKQYSGMIEMDPSLYADLGTNTNTTAPQWSETLYV